MLTGFAFALLLAAGQPQERPPGTEAVEEARPGFEFSYSWPIEAAAIPALDALLREEATRLRTESRASAEEMRRELGGDGGERPPYMFDKQWRTDANLDELVALSAAVYSYSGGAHGNSFYDALIWDRSARERIAFEDLFSDPEAAIAALTPAFCAALQAERAQRREGEEGRDDCPAIGDHPVALITGPSGRIETFRVLIEPYAAGSYAEGTYEIDVPVSDPVLRLVRARFGTAFVWR